MYRPLRFCEVITGAFESYSDRPAVLGNPAHASFLDGNDLHQRCLQSRTAALNYVLGVVDAHLSIFRAMETKYKLCVPGQAASGQITDVVCKHLADNPAERHFSGSFISLARSFPCS